MIGKTISHYRILEKLGEGGMGVVYKAEDTDLKRIVALKFLSPQALAGDEEKARFVHEAQAAAALNHSNICTIYEIGKHEGNSFIAMEYIEGQSLKDTISSGAMEIDGALHVAAQIGTALQKAHEKEIVHRDIKPGNVMITPEGQVKIMDFGLAKSSEHTRLTRTGSTVGTVAYMSPEQTRGDEVDHRTDVWSLGVILYEMVTGKVPFAGEFEQAVLYSILNEDPKPISECISTAPEGLQNVIDKALRKDSVERYQSADELLADLSLLKEGKGASAIGMRREGMGGQRKALLAGIGVAVIIAAAVLLSPYVAPPGIISLLTEDSAEEGPAVPEAESQEGAFVVVVAPFWDQTGDAAEESRVMQALIERRVSDELGGEEDVRILGRDIMDTPRTHDEARALGEKLGATIVVWGEVLVLRDEVEIQPFMTVVEYDYWTRDRSAAALLANLKEPSQLALRKAKAEEVGDMALLVAGAYYREKDPDKALSVLQRISPPTSESVRSQGHVYRDHGNLEEAIRLYEEAIELDPDDAWARVALGDAYQIQRRIEPAIEQYEIAIKNDSTLAYPRHNLGLMYYWQGKTEAAITEYERSIELAPDFHWPYNSLGLVYRQQGKLDEAIRLFEKATEVNPEYSLAYMNLGYSCWMLGDCQAATAHFEKAADIYPESAWFQSTLGYAHVINGEYEEAMAAMQKAIELKWEDPRVHLLVGLTYFHVGEFDSAVSMLSKAVDLNPGIVDYRIPLARAHLELGQYSAAVSSMEAAIQIDPAETYNHLLYSIVLCKAGRGTEARSHVGEFVKTLGDSAWAAPVVRFYAGECTEEEVFKAAEAPEPRTTKEQRSEAFYFMGMAHLLGLSSGDAPADTAKAREYLEKCIALDLRAADEYSWARRELERLTR